MELLERAGRDDLDGVKRLIQEGVDVNTTNSSNQTALYCGCKEGHTKVAQYLLDNGASVDLGEKPLIVAVRNNHYDCVKLLLEHNADVNCCNREGQSPVSIATIKHCYSTILLLLQYGAIPSASLGVIAIPLVKCANLKHVKTIEELIDAKIINLTHWRVFLACFRFAFKRGSVELADKMLAAADSRYSTVEQLYSRAAYYSAKNNWLTILSKLIQKEVDTNLLTNGKTPLFAACKQGHESVVNLLLNNGADSNVPNENCLDFIENISSPLQIVVKHGNVVIFDMLLRKGANLNPRGQPLLHIACDNGHGICKPVVRSVEQTLSITRLLLQQGVDINALYWGETALYVACEYERLKVVQILLEAGADVNITSNRHYPLISACKSGNVELINLLVKAGADVKYTDEYNITCLHAFINACLTRKGSCDSASKLDIVNTIKLLLEAGADVNVYSRCHGFLFHTVLYCASKAGDEVIVRLLLEAGAQTNSSTDRNPLYAACEQGYTKVVDLLLHHGAHSNASTRATLASIRCALKQGHTDIVYLLLKHLADVIKPHQSGKSTFVYFFKMLARQMCKTSEVSNTLDEGSLNMLKSMVLEGGDMNKLLQCDGWNALHIASSFNMCDIMRELIQNGANCNKLTKSGISALHIACEKGHEGAVELLLKNGARTCRENSTTRRNRGTIPSAKPALCTAAMNSSETIVKLLLNYGAAVNASDISGNTALHLASSSSIVEMLLNAGANVNATNRTSETVLSAICENRYDSNPRDNEPLEIKVSSMKELQHAINAATARPVKCQTDAKVVKMLLDFGADPNICSPLHTACTNNDLDTVRLLLEYGADANQVKSSTYAWMRTDLSLPPLCIACKNRNVAIVDCLLANGAAVTFADGDGKTPLHFTIERLAEQTSSTECDPIVAVLLQHNAAVNAVSNSGESPLYAACSRGLTGVLKQLLDYNADVDLTSSWNKYPLIIACEKNFSDIAMMLLDRGADANVCKDGQTPLKLASAHGDTVLVKQLLSCGADVNDTALHATILGNKGLHNKKFNNILWSCKQALPPSADAVYGNSEHMMFQKYGETLHQTDELGQPALHYSRTDSNITYITVATPLYLACARGMTDIVKLLLSHGASPNIGNDDKYPIFAACEGQHYDLVKLLLEFNTDVTIRDRYGQTTLHYAIRQLYTTDTLTVKHATVKIILSAGADTNAMDMFGTTPLYLACDRGMTDIVKLLLSHGASPNTGTDDNYPILAACNGQHCDSLKLLLEYNADVSVSDKKGNTALHHVLTSQARYKADSVKRSDLVQLLLDKGADSNTASEDGETPFYVACSNGLLSIVAKMLECGANVNGNLGKKLPLIDACRNNHTSVVQLLLTNGADPNIAEESYGLTLPLHAAADCSNRELVELLVKHGANIDATDTRGNTALHCVTAAHYVKGKVKSVVDILLENKADVNIANSSGETPLCRAVSRDLPDIVRIMLQQYGGNPNKGSPLVAACLVGNVELVELLLKHGANPDMASTTCGRYSRQQKLPLFIAVEQDNSRIISSLLNAGASVHIVNDEGQNIACFAAKRLNSIRYDNGIRNIVNNISTIRRLLQHGANFNILLPDGHSPLHLAVNAINEVQNLEVTNEYNVSLVVELLQLMVKHGAMLKDTVCLDSDMLRKSHRSGTLMSLTRFDDKHKCIVELLRAGAGFQVIATLCDALATRPQQAKSIRLCQAVILAGYSPSDEELLNLQVAAAGETDEGSLVEQLLSWLNEERQQVPSLVRQCRIAIRRQLSEAVHHQTIIPAIDKLPLPKDMKLYLQFDRKRTEVDLGINVELQNRESIEETFKEDWYEVSPCKIMKTMYTTNMITVTMTEYDHDDDYCSVVRRFWQECSATTANPEFTHSCCVQRTVWSICRRLTSGSSMANDH